MTRGYGLALVTVALAMTVTSALAYKALERRSDDALEVNLAGRQRTLSQRIAKGALLARATMAPGALAPLEADVREWGAVHRGLLDGDPARGLSGVRWAGVRGAIGSLDDEVAAVTTAAAAFGDAVRAGDAERADVALGDILRAEAAFLPTMDRAVFELGTHDVAAIEKLQGAIAVTLVALLVLLAALARFVLRPVVDEAVGAMAQLADHGRLLRTVIDTIPDHIYVKDAHGRATLRNAASARALGFADPGAAVGLTDAEAAAGLGTAGLAAAPLAEAALADDLRVVRTGEPVLNKEERAGDGGWLLTTKVPLRDHGGAVVGLVGVSRDVTASRSAEAKFRALVEHSGAGTVIVQDGRLVYANPRLHEMLGYDDGELAGRPALSIVHEGDHETVAENLRRRVEGEVDALHYPARCVTKDGRVLHVELAGVAVEHDGRPAVVGTVVDVTEREEAGQELAHRAHHDDLTGLPNRALFGARLAEAVASPARDYAVLFVDLDRFKAVNDTLGHSAGDALLQEVAARLLSTVRPSDTVARLGGDEFAVLLQGVEDGSSLPVSVAARVQRGLSAPFDVDGQVVTVGASVGIVSGRGDHAGPDDVLREADIAMYSSKRAGRGRSTVYSDDDHAATREGLRLEVDLPLAVERGEFRLAYQPVVRLADGVVVGVEALVRWDHPKLGLLYPDAFVGAAEASGSIAALDRWALGEACRQLAAWDAGTGGRLDLVVNVNCSGHDLLDPAYVEAVRSAPREAGVDPARVVLEITESTLVEGEAVRALEGLRREGVRLCIDDFGTGYSSLASLHGLPFDRLKVDRSFVAQMTDRYESAALVETVVALGRHLGKPVIAEGVETSEHLDALRELGCAFGQGYHFARPLWSSEVTSRLTSGPEPWVLPGPAGGDSTGGLTHSSNGSLLRQASPATS